MSSKDHITPWPHVIVLSLHLVAVRLTVVPIYHVKHFYSFGFVSVTQETSKHFVTDWKV